MQAQRCTRAQQPLLMSRPLNPGSQSAGMTADIKAGSLDNTDRVHSQPPGGVLADLKDFTLLQQFVSQTSFFCHQGGKLTPGGEGLIKYAQKNM